MQSLQTMSARAVFAMFICIAMSVFSPSAYAHSDHRTGDEALSQYLLDNSDQRMRNVTAFTIDNDEVTFGGLGSDQDSQFEIVSVTKTFTYDLMRQAIYEKKITPEETFGELAGITDAEASTVTLLELSNHKGGLPDIPSAYFAEATGYLFANQSPF